jgi:Phytanoyl-CoA dioxygenase (PhyH)
MNTLSQQQLRNPDYEQILYRSGILGLDCPYDRASLATLQASLDPIFADQGPSHRSYVKAKDLQDLGLLDQVFNGAMRSAIRALIPDAVLYHCHLYEIAANQDQPHIEGHLLNGWHRDYDAFYPGVEPREPHCLSLFVYLSDVASFEDGPFELLPEFRSDFAEGLPTTRVVGPAGTTFVFTRTFFHRANPNRGDRRRRVLKLSIQSGALANGPIDQGEFREVLAGIPAADLFLRQLFGADYQPGRIATLPDIHAESPAIVPLPINAKTELTWDQRLKLLGQKVQNRVKSKLGRSR